MFLSLQKWSCMQKAKHQVQNPAHTFSWVKPSTGMIKCKVHATMFDNNTIIRYNMCFTNSVGQHTIIRYDMCFTNSLGQLLLGKSRFLLSADTVLEAEFIALLESIKTATSNGMHIVLFETNCKSLVDTITSSIVPISKFGNLVS